MATNGHGASTAHTNGHSNRDFAPNEQAYYQNGRYENGDGVPKPHQATVSQVYAPMSRPGNPGPLGLISFALTTFCLGFYQCGVGYVSLPSFLLAPKYTFICLRILDR